MEVRTGICFLTLRGSGGIGFPPHSSTDVFVLFRGKPKLFLTYCAGSALLPVIARRTAHRRRFSSPKPASGGVYPGMGPSSAVFDRFLFASSGSLGKPNPGFQNLPVRYLPPDHEGGKSRPMNRAHRQFSRNRETPRKQLLSVHFLGCSCSHSSLLTFCALC